MIYILSAYQTPACLNCCLSSSNAKIRSIHSLLRIDIGNIQMAKLIQRQPKKIQKSINKLGNEIFKDFLQITMSNLKIISPKFLNTVIQHMKQAKLVRLVQPHYSYVALSTHVFEMYIFMKVLSNLNLRFSNLPSLKMQTHQAIMRTLMGL